MLEVTDSGKEAVTPSRQPETTRDATIPDPILTIDGYALAHPLFRLSAYVFDAVIVGALAALLSYIVSVIANATPFNVSAQFVPWGIAMGILVALYPLFFWRSFSRTPGKMIAGLRIVNKNGERMGTTRTVIRLIFFGLTHAFVFIGFLWLLFDSRHQGIHDMLSGTYVIDERRGRIATNQRRQ